MAVSEAQKKASDRYNAAHMATIGCKMKKEKVAAFKKYCTERGTTPNAVLSEFVLSCIKDEETTDDQ